MVFIVIVIVIFYFMISKFNLSGNVKYFFWVKKRIMENIEIAG